MQFFRSCSGLLCDFLDDSLLRSWSNFGRPTTTVPFVDNGSERGSLESQSLRNGFITLSRLIHVNYFVSNLFFNLFRSQHGVFLCKLLASTPDFESLGLTVEKDIPHLNYNRCCLQCPTHTISVSLQRRPFGLYYPSIQS